MPQPVATTAPVYPSELAASGLSGTAVIEGLVQTDGTFAVVRIRQADHPAFGTAASTACQSWRFEPTSAGESSTPVHIAIPFRFVSPLEQQINAACKRQVYRPLSEAPLSVEDYGGKPKARKKIKPVYPAELKEKRLQGDVTVEFVVAPDGTTLNPRIQGRPWPGFVQAALLAVAKATFEPPVKAGQGVHVAMTATVRIVPPTLFVRHYASPPLLNPFTPVPPVNPATTTCPR